MTRSNWACSGPGIVVTWLAFFELSPSPGATTLRRMDLPELVGRADRVVHGVVTETKVYWDASHRRIHTDTILDVIEDLKGDGPARLTVTMLGGRIDPIEMSVEGTPIFREGEEVVVMTSPRPDGKKNLVGFSQGVFRIEEDPRTGIRYAVAAGHAGASWLDVPGAPEGGPPDRASRLLLPLELFTEKVRALASPGVAEPDSSNRRPMLAPTGGSKETP